MSGGKHEYSDDILVGMEDLKARNVVVDENASPMDCLMVVMEVAVLKLNEHRSKMESLMREKALKKPIRIFGVNLQADYESSLTIKKGKDVAVADESKEKLLSSAAMEYHRRDGVDYSSWLSFNTGGDDEGSKKRSKKPRTTESPAEEKLMDCAMKSYKWNNGFDRKSFRTSPDQSHEVEENLKKKKNKSGSNGGLKRKFSATSGESSEVNDKMLNNSNTATNTSDPPPGLPQEFKDKIFEMQGENPVLLIQKRLFTTDTTDNHNRLSIPERKLLTRGFLTETEKQLIGKPNHSGMTIPTGGGQDHIVFKNDGSMIAVIIQPSLKVGGIDFTRWEMSKQSKKHGSGKQDSRKNYSYVLKNKWNALRRGNNLNENDLVQVWAFRVRGKLAFALVKIDEGSCTPQQAAENGTNNGSGNGSRSGVTEACAGPSQTKPVEDGNVSDDDSNGMDVTAGIDSYPSHINVELTDMQGANVTNNGSDDGGSHISNVADSTPTQSQIEGQA